jgi:nitrite reductase (NO-forming)
MPARLALHRLIPLVVGVLCLSAGCTGGPTRSPEPTAPAGPPPALADAVNISRDPAEVPKPIGSRPPQTVVVHVETIEVNGKLADGVTHSYWTFGAKVPGPMIRARVGDTVELHIKNNPNSQNIHSIDLHSVTGPGGGSVATMVKPGEERIIRFAALNPGLFVYHCASPHIPTHIAQGMYGLMVVEPADGLPKVDHEFYLVQGEMYTEGARGTKGHLAFDSDKMFHEDPDYVVFNGQFKGLTAEPTMKVKRGERVRLFVGNAGPNLASSFHIIGEILEKVNHEGASESVSNVATTIIPSGGAAIVEFTPAVPGRFIFVDHSISRGIDKGALGYIDVTGAPNPADFDPVTGVEQGVGH